jgi:tRNA A-37 threonylcarbamoyl transferase component Bud32
MAAPPRRPTIEPDLLVDAERAERAGDMTGAASALRAHLDRHADDTAARLRFARVLMACGEREAGRHALRPLDAPGAQPATVAVEVNRILAELDEADGALLAATERWERILADDIDDAQARARLRALRPSPVPAGAGPNETLVSPEGLETLRYRLARELGRGATAAVYLAHDQALGIDVALKVLHPQLAGTARSDARQRFFAEARVAAAVRHPGVVAIYDVDEAARALSMEYVTGGTLRGRLRERAGPLPPEELVETGRALLDALAFVHARGILHGDVKPSNLLLRAPGQVVLADFGAAELGGEARATAAGTPLYLAPEQFRGDRPSRATDLYAAGAILWEVAAGRPMRSQVDLVEGRAALAPPLAADAQEALGATGPVVAALVAQLTHPDPGARPAAAQARARLG